MVSSEAEAEAGRLLVALQPPPPLVVGDFDSDGGYTIRSSSAGSIVVIIFWNGSGRRRRGRLDGFKAGAQRNRGIAIASGLGWLVTKPASILNLHLLHYRTPYLPVHSNKTSL